MQTALTSLQKVKRINTLARSYKKQDGEECWMVGGFYYPVKSDKKGIDWDKYKEFMDKQKELK